MVDPLSRKTSVCYTGSRLARTGLSLEQIALPGGFLPHAQLVQL